MNLQQALDYLSPEINEVEGWAESEYQKYFALYFKGEVELYKKLKDNESLIEDTDLEWILTYLPLELFSVSEQLSKLKTRQEVIKLHIKDEEASYIETHANTGQSKTAVKEEAMQQTAEDRLLVDVYNSIAERVNREISFSRELIMSAKKIWDARRASEAPVTVITKGIDDLPDYIPEAQTYIK
jgi:hypothetical protein